MPTYDYRCPNGHDFEHFFSKISDSTAEFVCPSCGAMAERRVSGGAGLVFKGSGFYLTDYGKNAHRKSGGESKSGTSSGESAGATKSEASKSESGASPSASGSSSSGNASDSGSSTPKGEGAKSSESKSSSPPKKSSGDGQ